MDLETPVVVMDVTGQRQRPLHDELVERIDQDRIKNGCEISWDPRSVRRNPALYSEKHTKNQNGALLYIKKDTRTHRRSGTTELLHTSSFLKSFAKEL